MAFIDCEIKWKHGAATTDISSSVVSYTREQNICTGIGTLNVVVDYGAGYGFTVWDRLVLYEEGHKRGTYFIAEDVKTIGNGNKQLVCQDASKKLVDYFIVESYYIDYPTYTRTWITKFVEEAGVDYQFETASVGTLISNNSSLGKSSAYDTIQTLLQQSGWYMYVDNDNKLHIGDINKNLSSPEWTLRSTDILTINTNLNDKYLRNRAVVWGEGNGDEWVFADESRHTPWDHGTKDQRTVVLSNGNIGSSTAAHNLAQKLLDEFAQLDHIKEIEVVGYHRAEIGDVGRVKTKYWSGLGLVTTVGSSLSSGGLKTRIILDQRCPRLFGYFGFRSYVYIGTNGAGVWRKELGGDTWEAFSTGMDQFNVTDLIVKGGVFACTAGGNGYINLDSTTADWFKYEAGGFTDFDGVGAIAYDSSEVEAVACDIDDKTHEIYFGFRFNSAALATYGVYKSWIDVVDAEGNRLNQYQLQGDITQKWFKLVDIEKYGNKIMPTAEAPSEYAPDDVLLGVRRSYIAATPSLSASTYGPTPSDTSYDDAIFFVDNGGFTSSGMDIEGSSIAVAANLSTFSINTNYFNFFAFDEDDNIYKAIKPYHTATNYYHDSFGDGTTLLHRILQRSSGDGEEADTSYDSTRPYTIVDIVRYASNHSSHSSLYGFFYTVTPLIARPIYHNPVHAASTSNVLLSIFVPGPSEIDGVTLSPGMRVLLKDQTDPTENGIYTVTSGLWVRATDADQNAEMVRGLCTSVLYGDTNIYKVFQLDIDEDITPSIGSTEFTFTEVLALTEDGAQLLLDDSALDDNKAGWPTSVMMVEGVIYVLVIGHKQEVGDTHSMRTSYMIVIGDDGTSTIKYDRIRETVLGIDTYPIVTIRKEFMVACDSGVAACRVHTTVNNGAAGSSSAVILDAYTFNGTDITYGSQTLVSNNDSGLGDWGYYGHPIHSAGVSIADAAWVGSNLDDGITPYIKFKASAGAQGMYQCCFNLECPGGVAVAFDRVDKFATGIVDLRSMDFVTRHEYSRGSTVSNCTEFGFDDWDYTKVNFNLSNIKAVTCRGQTPKYIYNSNQIWDSVLDEQVGSLTHTGSVAAHMDDFDGSFYIAPGGGVIYKEAPTGGTVATIRMFTGRYGEHTGPTTGFVVTNALLIGNSGSYTINKFRDRYILNDMNLCYLMQKNTDDSFRIRNYDFYSFRTEEDKGKPLMSFTVPSGVTFYEVGGETHFTNNAEHFRIYTDTFSAHTASGQYNDLRSFDVSTYLYTEDGYQSLDKGKYILAARRDGTTRYYPMDNLRGSQQFFGNLSTLGNTEVGKVETSNYYYPPWFFHSYSGTTTTPEFFEMAPGASGFMDYSSTLPGFDITVIRLDDHM